MKRGYVQTYEWVVKLLQDCNFADSARRLGLRETPQRAVTLDFLGRTYAVDKNGVELVGEKIKWSVKSEGFEHNAKSVLGYYVLSNANVEPLHEYCLLGAFSHGVFGRSPSAAGGLEKAFGADYTLFCRTAEKLGAVFEAEKARGQYRWSYTLLPKVPVKIMYYEGDDEYPTRIPILYDKTAIQIYKFEPLAVLNSCFIEGFASIGESL